MKMLQYINILKGTIFLKIHVQFEKLAPTSKLVLY